jgi:hypothetical protein
MATSTTIYAGALVCINASGLAVPAADTSGFKCVVGVAMETVTSASSGSYYVDVQEGTYLLTASSITQAHVNSVMMVVDDATVDNSSTNSVPAGVLVEYVSATQGWVKVGVGLRQS